jgi:hypothetical protein
VPSVVDLRSAHLELLSVKPEYGYVNFDALAVLAQAVQFAHVPAGALIEMLWMAETGEAAQGEEEESVHIIV